MHNKNKHNLKEWHKSQRLIHTTEFDIQTVRMNSVDLSTSSSEATSTMQKEAQL